MFVYRKGYLAYELSNKEARRNDWWHVKNDFGEQELCTVW